jgi:hypothetical protein
VDNFIVNSQACYNIKTEQSLGKNVIVIELWMERAITLVNHIILELVRKMQMVYWVKTS